MYYYFQSEYVLLWIKVEQIQTTMLFSFWLQKVCQCIGITCNLDGPWFHVVHCVFHISVHSLVVIEAMCGHAHRVLWADHAVKYVKPNVCVM